MNNQQLGVARPQCEGSLRRHPSSVVWSLFRHLSSVICRPSSGLSVSIREVRKRIRRIRGLGRAGLGIKVVYGLVDQLKRASYSVPANIVEGQSRNTTKDYLHFLFNARGSLEETRYFLLLSKDFGFLNEEKYSNLENKYSHISKMLNKMISSLKLRD